MVRSFSDRVLGGVCGGLGAALHLRPWLIRLIWVVLTVASLGAFAALYLLLWWIVPQESPMARRRGFPVILVLLLVVLTVAAWVGRELGQLNTPSGVNLFWPGALVILCAVFFLRQLRA
ncbi:MAG TPA: PspC domain-containing protein [Phototrophicaceae bacterium]|nr:PspC domain-containing protein [Phototrophicaceae bacterium]